MQFIYDLRFAKFGEWSSLSCGAGASENFESRARRSLQGGGGRRDLPMYEVRFGRFVRLRRGGAEQVRTRIYGGAMRRFFRLIHVCRNSFRAIIMMTACCHIFLMRINLDISHKIVVPVDYLLSNAFALITPPKKACKSALIRACST